MFLCDSNPCLVKRRFINLSTTCITLLPSSVTFTSSVSSLLVREALKCSRIAFCPTRDAEAEKEPDI